MRPLPISSDYGQMTESDVEDSAFFAVSFMLVFLVQRRPLRTVAGIGRTMELSKSCVRDSSSSSKLETEPGVNHSSAPIEYQTHPSHKRRCCIKGHPVVSGQMSHFKINDLHPKCLFDVSCDVADGRPNHHHAVSSLSCHKGRT